MDINDLFENIVYIVNQFANEVVEQCLQEKMIETGRGSETKGKKTENLQLKRK
jgi:hypothetical protein